MSKKRRKKEDAAPTEEMTPVENEAAAESETQTEEPVVQAEQEPSAEAETLTETELVTEVEAVEIDALLGEDVPVEAEGEAPEGEEVPTESSEEPELRYQLKQVLEAIMFASQKPLSVKEITSVLKGAAEADKENPASVAMPFAKVKEAQLRAAIEELELEYSDPGRTYEVRESAAGWQLVTKPDYAPWLRQLFPENRSARLSAPAMETLAIIAYRQPITRGDIEAVRGVAVDGVMQTLLDRGLIKIDGRAEIPGRPLLYGTTQNFMEHFGLKNLDDLPNAGELRKISLPTAEPPAAETPAADAPAVEGPATEAAAEEVTAETAATPEAEVETPAEHPADFLDEGAGEAAGETEEGVVLPETEAEIAAEETLPEESPEAASTPEPESSNQS